MSDLKERQKIKDRLVTDKAMAWACDKDGLDIEERKLIVELCHIIERQKANEAKTEAEIALHKHFVNACTWKDKLEALIDGLEIENKEKLINDSDVETYKMLGEVMASKIKQLKYWR